MTADVAIRPDVGFIALAFGRAALIDRRPEAMFAPSVASVLQVLNPFVWSTLRPRQVATFARFVIR